MDSRLRDAHDPVSHRDDAVSLIGIAPKDLVRKADLEF
jgi:hypothetical protein